MRDAGPTAHQQIASRNVANGVESRPLRTSVCWIFIGLNGLLAFSTFMPWVRTGFVEASGVEARLGLFVLIAAIAGAGVSGMSLAHGRAVMGLRVVQFVVAALSLATVGLTAAAISEACSDSIFCIQPQPGGGLYVAGIASVALAVIAMVRSPKASD